MPPLYGQVVAGPPGSGKTTYCTGMQEYLRLLGRNAWVINLDPANEVPKEPLYVPPQPSSNNEDEDDVNDESKSQPIDKQEENKKSLPYDTLLDVCESVVNLSSVMKQMGLGPNGGLVYCMEYLEAHASQVVQMILDKINNNDHDPTMQNPYLILDLPGQVELYTHGTAVPRLLQELVKVLDLRLVAIQLIDSQSCTEPANFLSATLLATTTMLRLELPTVSVLSKIDLLANYGPLPFSLDFFAECHDLDRLLPFLSGGGGGGGALSDDIDDDEELFQDQRKNGKTYHTHDDFDYTEDPDYIQARRRSRASPFFKQHEKLHHAMAELVEEFSLLSFLPLDISNAESVGRVLARIDKCNGYIFLDHAQPHVRQQRQPQQQTISAAQNLFDVAVQSEPSSQHYEMMADIQERLADTRRYKNNQETNETR